MIFFFFLIRKLENILTKKGQAPKVYKGYTGDLLGENEKRYISDCYLGTTKTLHIGAP